MEQRDLFDREQHIGVLVFGRAGTGRTMVVNNAEDGMIVLDETGRYARISTVLGGREGKLPPGGELDPLDPGDVSHGERSR